ncbi:FAD:protein FMN transferase [Hahella sp. CCB-MM4]|uniref:FAD:protein FMN transferase n=1 Tax=Hahella sp. (strain CCB-MM4) TaxID=1926491 RepID=UPI001FED8F69|nr:FAD:protein FMN transferase [Hahella sp. CCB-MM4]
MTGSLLLLISAFTNAQWYERSWNAMGTRIHVEVSDESESHANLLFDQVFREFYRLEESMSSYIDTSEVSIVNQNAAEAPVKVSRELIDLIKKSFQVSKISNGAFDITYASVGRYYDYRKNQAPDESQIEANLDAIDYRHVVVDEKASTISFTHPHVYIDLGGIAKGYAVDRAIDILRQGGVISGMVSAGGDTQLIGNKLGKPWIVGIKDPRREEESAVLLPLENTAISTSGDYERYFIQDGVRYHHIISPKTGRSAGEVQSVTILGPDSTTTDALSTTVFVLGVEKGLELVERLPGIDAIIVDQHRKMHYSSELSTPGE